MTPTYLIEKIARHGTAIERLSRELDTESGEFAGMEKTTAVAFDAADFVWAFFAHRGIEEVHESRQLRNQIAQELLKIFEQYPELNRQDTGH